MQCGTQSQDPEIMTRVEGKWLTEPPRFLCEYLKKKKKKDFEENESMSQGEREKQALLY